MTQQDKREMFRHNLYMAVLNAHKHGMSWHHIREALTDETSAIADTDDLAMREETTLEHVARDMREGRFPQRSEPRQVTEPSDVVGHKTIDTGERCPEPGTPIMRHEPLTRAEADALCAAAYAAKEDREKRMPDEQSALRAMMDGWIRLKELGWREGIYCPRDGTRFRVIELGSTGIFDGDCTGEWPRCTTNVIVISHVWTTYDEHDAYPSS